MEPNTATAVRLIFKHSLLVRGAADVWHVDEVDVLLILYLLILNRLQVVHRLEVVIVIGNHFTAYMAKLALSWIHHHHVDRITTRLLYTIWVLTMCKGLVRVHFISVELLMLSFGHVYFRVGIRLFGHSDILSIRTSHTWLHILVLLYYKVANR